MKLVADGTTLAAAISWVTATFDSKDDRAFVALEVNSDGEGFLFHQNSTSYLKKPFGVQSIDFDDDDADAESILLALEGQYLVRLKEAIGDGPIKFSKKLNDKTSPLVGRTSFGHFTIPVLDFKAPSAPKTVSIGEVDEAEFFDSLKRLSDICDKNGGQVPATTTVDIFFDSKAETVSMMATDRYVVSELILPFEKSAKSDSKYLDDVNHVLLPQESARLGLNSRSGSNVELVNDERGGKFGYVFPDGSFALFTVKDATPINISGMKKAASRENEGWNTIQVSASELRKAIKIVLDLSWNEDYVYFTTKDDKLIISDSAGTNKVAVSAEIEESDPLTIKFTKSTIQSAFKAVSSDRIVVRWNSENKPFIMDQVLEDSVIDDNSMIIFVPSRV